MGEAVHDELFYLSMVIFKVEGCLFKVPRRHLEQGSEIFRDMFSVPSTQAGVVEGLSDDKPITLEGIRKDDFRQLLRVVYTIYPKQLDLSIAEWTSVLKLATMWAFNDIRDLSIKELSKLQVPDLDKLVLAKTYHIDDWRLPALLALVQREKPMGLEEVNLLGVDWVLKIAEVREYAPSISSTSTMTFSFATCPQCKRANQQCHYTSCGHYINQNYDSQIPKAISVNRSTIDYTGKIKQVFGL